MLLKFNINPIKKDDHLQQIKQQQNGCPTDADCRLFQKAGPDKIILIKLKKRAGPCDFCQCNVILNQLSKHQRSKKCHHIRKLL
jgi:hypothetical protein